ncbi:MAG: RNA ligase RtcB family protein [Bacillota bacterium]|nr:RNA ligase RtcB family protein [Bacillota bacterium]
MIRVVKSDKSWIESSAVEQLKKVAELKGIISAVGLPDLHPGKTPVGASFVSKDIIYPHIIGNDIGCGMSLFCTSITKKKFKIPKVMKELEKLDFLNEIDASTFTNKIEKQFIDKLGTIGGGNHFAEFQELSEVFDEEAVKEIGVDKSKVLLLVHSGSRSYGEYILRKYIENYSCQNGLQENSKPFREYMEEHESAIQFAALNRELIAEKLITSINNKGFKKLLDSVHNSITQKESKGETYYIHRKGAAPSDIGYVVVAGSRGSKSYIVKPIGNIQDYAFSISHGAGRKWARLSCKDRLEKLYYKREVKLNELSYNLICKDKNLVYEEAPEAYKNINRVIEDMLNENMIKLVASLKPLITYKG